jgi:hypothetical protein
MTITLTHYPKLSNGRESTVNRLLDGSIYAGEKLVPFSLKFFLLGVKKYNNLYLRLVTPSSG